MILKTSLNIYGLRPSSEWLHRHPMFLHPYPMFLHRHPIFLHRNPIPDRQAKHRVDRAFSWLNGRKYRPSCQMAEASSGRGFVVFSRMSQPLYGEDRFEIIGCEGKSCRPPSLVRMHSAWRVLAFWDLYLESDTSRARRTGWKVYGMMRQNRSVADYGCKAGASIAPIEF
jgi:hypothetical protein